MTSKAALYTGDAFHHDWSTGTLDTVRAFGAEQLIGGRGAVARTGAEVRAAIEQTDPGLARDIDSGRFAEPFWYVDSPLTTPDPTRPFEGRPPKGHTPAPAPGVLAPDLPVTVPERAALTRLRQLLREGFMVLLDNGDDAAAVRRATKRTTAADVTTVALDRTENGAAVMDVLGMRRGEAWIVRPDAYVAAVVDAADADAVTVALRRALGF